MSGSNGHLRLIDQLPGCMAEDPFLEGFLSIVEEIQASVLQHLDGLDYFLDPHVASLPVIEWLGALSGVGVRAGLDERTHRRLVSTQRRLFPMRGTRRGVEELLAALTGGEVTVDEGEAGGVFREGRAPRGTRRIVIDLATTGTLRIDQVTAVIDQEIPAGLEYLLTVDGAAAATGPGRRVGSFAQVVAARIEPQVAFEAATPSEEEM